MKAFLAGKLIAIITLIFMAPSPAVASVSLSATVPSGQPVGTLVTWHVATTEPDPVEFRLTITHDGGQGRVIFDFGSKNTFEWTPIEEGLYTVTAIVRSAGSTFATATQHDVLPLATSEPVITLTSHPLMAIYSAPSCTPGNRMRVYFKPITPIFAPFPTITNFKPCQPGRSMNFYIAGMLADTDYGLVHQVVDSNDMVLETGPVLSHRTGPLPYAFPSLEHLEPPANGIGSMEQVLLVSSLGGFGISTGAFDPLPFASDIFGRVIWYDDRSVDSDSFLLRSVAGGTQLRTQTMHTVDGPVPGKILQEVDLAGYVIRETNAPRVNEQLRALGFTDVFTSFHHAARRLPNGHTLVLGYVERMVEDLQGPGVVNVLADYIVDLDENWRVSWAWNAFDHLDLARVAILGEVCESVGPGCPRLFLSDSANDWLHSNSIAYSASDGNLLVSMRHQDWVIKIDYQDGAGNGEVLWRLGVGGDFDLAAEDPYPFQSHQHDVNFVGENDDQIVLFDNGNTRCALSQDPCSSRGQVYGLDESTLSATLLMNADLGVFSIGLGSAQPLSNGNFHFNAGVEKGDVSSSIGLEINGVGNRIFSLAADTAIYRSFRIPSLYFTTSSGVPLPTASP